jgi:hypothetical protein
VTDPRRPSPASSRLVQIQYSFGQPFTFLKTVWKSPASDPHDALEKYGVETG